MRDRLSTAKHQLGHNGSRESSHGQAASFRGPAPYLNMFFFFCLQSCQDMATTPKYVKEGGTWGWGLTPVHAFFDSSNIRLWFTVCACCPSERRIHNQDPTRSRAMHQIDIDWPLWKQFGSCGSLCWSVCSMPQLWALCHLGVWQSCETRQNDCARDLCLSAHGALTRSIESCPTPGSRVFPMLVPRHEEYQ